MTALVTIIHVFVCLVLIIAVLLQSGKAADLAGAFGGAGSQSSFGPRSTETLLSKVTKASAILFMVTSLGLWVLSGVEKQSAVSGEDAAPVKTTAAAPVETKTDATPPATPPAGKPDEKSAAAETKAPVEKPPVSKTEAPPPAAPVKK